MRGRPPSSAASPHSLTLTLSRGCLQEAELHSGHKGAAAIEYLIFRHGHILAELRALHRRCSQVDGEGRALDERLETLQAACRAILAL